VRDGGRREEGGGREVEEGGREGSLFAMAYRMAMLLVFCTFTWRIPVMISHTSVAKLRQHSGLYSTALGEC